MVHNGIPTICIYALSRDDVHINRIMRVRKIAFAATTTPFGIYAQILMYGKFMYETSNLLSRLSLQKIHIFQFARSVFMIGKYFYDKRSSIFSVLLFLSRIFGHILANTITNCLRRSCLKGVFSTGCTDCFQKLPSLRSA